MERKRFRDFRIDHFLFASPASTRDLYLLLYGRLKQAKKKNSVKLGKPFRRRPAPSQFPFGASEEEEEEEGGGGR